MGRGKGRLDMSLPASPRQARRRRRWSQSPRRKCGWAAACRRCRRRRGQDPSCPSRRPWCPAKSEARRVSKRETGAGREQTGGRPGGRRLAHHGKTHAAVVVDNVAEKLGGGSHGDALSVSQLIEAGTRGERAHVRNRLKAADMCMLFSFSVGSRQRRSIACVSDYTRTGIHAPGHAPSRSSRQRRQPSCPGGRG